MGQGADITRRQLLYWLAPACGGCMTAASSSEGLQVRLERERIRVAAPQLRFVTGNPLERLHSGAPAPFAIQLSLSTDRWSNTLLRDIERFVFSYDLWEEKFSVAKLGRPRRTVSQLEVRAAEGWCVDEMALDPAGIAERQPFWLRLEVRAENPGEQPLDVSEGVSLTKLVELFSRRGKREPSRWELDAGPLLLAELKRPVGVRR
jgi:hypothetical protein